MADTKEILLQKIKIQGDLVRKLKAEKESKDKVSLYNQNLFFTYIFFF